MMNKITAYKFKCKMCSFMFFYHTAINCPKCGNEVIDVTAFGDPRTMDADSVPLACGGIAYDVLTALEAKKIYWPQEKTTENIILDSGHRTEFATGAVRDMHDGKGRYDLLPWDAIHELAQHCEHGAKKYGERNCEKGIPIHSLIDSAIRHLSCYLRGMKDEPHLRAALWNIAFAIWMEKNRPEMQDVPGRKS